MKNIINKIAYSVLALTLYSAPAHAAWTSYSVKDGSNRLLNNSTTCEHRMTIFPSWQVVGTGYYTLNRTHFDFVDYQYNYQTNPSYQSVTFSFRVTEDFVDRLVPLVSINGTVNLGGGLLASGSGNRAGLLSYINEVRNGTVKFDCSLTTNVPASSSTIGVAPFLSCTRRRVNSDIVTMASYAIDPALARIQENCA